MSISIKHGLDGFMHIYMYVYMKKLVTFRCDTYLPLFLSWLDRGKHLNNRRKAPGLDLLSPSFTVFKISIC